MNPYNVIKGVLTVLGVALLVLIGFGAYQYYFLKPTPIINNIIQPGANATIQQGQGLAKTKALFTEVYGQLDTDKEWTGGVRCGIRF